jgi:hypothetical protein
MARPLKISTDSRPRSPRGRKSPIDSDPRRARIERELAMGVSEFRVAARYGYSHDVINRFRNRMPPQLKAAVLLAALRPSETDLDKVRKEEGESILINLAAQRARLLVLQDQCMEADASRETHETIRDIGWLAQVIHKNIELSGKYLGLFAQHTVSTKVNILLSEDYLRMRQALVMALEPYPAARRAVVEAMQRIEGEVTTKMLAAKSAQDAARGAPGTVIDQAPIDVTPTVPRLQRGPNSAVDGVQR